MAIRQALRRSQALRLVKFGKTDMMVSEVCAGTMTWGSYDASEVSAQAQLDTLVEMGVNFFDTAELYPTGFNYGKTTEQWIGNWLHQRTSAGSLNRDKIYLATKCNPAGIGASLPDREGKPHSYDKEMLLSSCKASIERLQCGYIDLYYLHWPSRDSAIFGGKVAYEPGGKSREGSYNDEGTIDIFESQVRSVKELFDQGLIRHWGLSNENAFGITTFCLICDKLGCPRPVCVQNDFSLLNRGFEVDVAEACHRLGIVGIPYGALAGGTLTGKYYNPERYALDGKLANARHKVCPDHQPRYFYPTSRAATEHYVRLAEEYGLTPTELALAWSKQRFYNCCVIIGIKTVRQVKECVNAFKIEELPPCLLQKVDEIHEQFRNPMCILADKSALVRADWLPGATPAGSRKPLRSQEAKWTAKTQGTSKAKPKAVAPGQARTITTGVKKLPAKKK